MQIQKTFDFDAPKKVQQSQKEPEEVATDTSLPPPSQSLDSRHSVLSHEQLERLAKDFNGELIWAKLAWKETLSSGQVVAVRDVRNQDIARYRVTESGPSTHARLELISGQLPEPSLLPPPPLISLTARLSIQTLHPITIGQKLKNFTTETQLQLTVSRLICRSGTGQVHAFSG